MNIIPIFTKSHTVINFGEADAFYVAYTETTTSQQYQEGSYLLQREKKDLGRGKEVGILSWAL